MPEIGQTMSPFKILEKLGTGGMGVVYKAEDFVNRRGAVHHSGGGHFLFGSWCIHEDNVSRGTQ